MGGIVIGGSTPASAATTPGVALAPYHTPAGTPLGSTVQRLVSGPLAPALVIFLASAWSAAQGIDDHFISFSDGVYTYIAAAVATHGPGILYGRVVLSQPPGIVLSAALLWHLRPGLLTIRVGLAALGVLVAILTYALARDLELSRVMAVTAAFLAVAGPVRAQFGGLDGEALLTPLAVGLALIVRRSGVLLVAATIAAGFLIKVTWLPFAVAGLAAVWWQQGLRALLRVAATTAILLCVAYGAMVATFGWRPSLMLVEIVTAESHSGLQIRLLPGIIVLTALLWWPLIPMAAVGARTVPPAARLLAVAGGVSALAMVKQGTFQNVLDPLEPILSVLAVAGAVHLWKRRSSVGRALVTVCVAGLALHSISLTSATSARVLPPPFGAQILNVHDQEAVDRAAAALDTVSRPNEPVLVNPLIAVVAHRQEVDGQADWFILNALSRHCSGTAFTAICRLWPHIALSVRSRRAAAVSIDANVMAFDPSFARTTMARAGKLLLRVDSPPLNTSIYALRPAHRGGNARSVRG